MKMIDYINDFTSHLTEAMEIGESSKFNNTDRSFSNILICGLGGSGIGGTILNDIVSGETHIPILSSKDYSIPNFVNENTLVVASSYSVVPPPGSCNLHDYDLNLYEYFPTNASM